MLLQLQAGGSGATRASAAAALYVWLEQLGVFLPADASQEVPHTQTASGDGVRGLLRRSGVRVRACC